jgi:hypothetical protein
MKIEKVDKYSDEALKAVNELLPQLSSSAASLDEKALTNIIESE